MADEVAERSPALGAVRLPTVLQAHLRRVVLDVPRQLNVTQRFSHGLSFNVNYTYRRGLHVLRGRNLNAPVNGVRPDAAFANVVEVVNDAAQRVHHWQWQPRENLEKTEQHPERKKELLLNSGKTRKIARSFHRRVNQTTCEAVYKFR